LFWMKLINYLTVIKVILHLHYWRFRSNKTICFINFLEKWDMSLSKVMFIATSNNMAAINLRWRDRMEIIKMSGYTIERKGRNCTSALFPRQLKSMVWQLKDLTIGKTTIGKNCWRIHPWIWVRGLEAKITQVIRNALKSVALEEEYNKDRWRHIIKHLVFPD
jgi:ATP-dependent Lon protease